MRQLLLPAVLLVSVAGCTVQERMNPAAGSPLAEHEQGRGLARLNPSPKRAYTLVATVKDAPGTFEAMTATAQYDVINENACGHINRSSGTAERITSNETFVLEKVSDTEYRGKFYLDLMQDEDYYGRGVCHWELMEARIVLQATGAPGEAHFVAGLRLENVLENTPRTLYFTRRGYPARDVPDYPDFGRTDPTRFDIPLQKDLFSITLHADAV